jgi:hypothetical protein
LNVYPAGERHALLIFSRQPEGSEPDWILAEFHANNAGWSNVELQDSSVIDPEKLDSEPLARESYEDATARGSLLVFSDACE